MSWVWSCRQFVGMAGLSGEGSMTQPVPSSSKREGQQSTKPAVRIFGKQAHPDDTRWQSLAGRIVLYNRAAQIWGWFCFLYFYYILKISRFSKLFFLGEGVMPHRSTRVEARGQFPGVPLFFCPVDSVAHTQISRLSSTCLTQWVVSLAQSGILD